MDTALLTALLLLLLLIAVIFCLFGGSLIPDRITPFTRLPEAAQARVLRQKQLLRGSALGLFLLAALAMFTSLPRGVPVGIVLAGFYCQYSVFCLRRRYPVYPPALGAEKDGKRPPLSRSG